MSWARDLGILVLSLGIASAVSLAGSAGMSARAQARLQGLDRRIGQSMTRMEQRHSRLKADIRYQTRSMAVTAPAVAATGVLAAGTEAVVEEEAPAAPSHPLLGNWRCSFRQGEFSYPPMACHIRRKDGGFFLEKTQGSQRIKGTVTLQGDDRFTFAGLYFCPFGSCDQRTSGSFTRKSRDHWVGKLRDGGFETVVTLKRPRAKAVAPKSKAPSKPIAPRTRSRSRSGGELLDEF